MRILLINNVFPPGFVGGYELGALEVAQSLGARGHEVTVMTSDYFQDEGSEITDIHVERSLKCYFVSHEVNGGVRTTLSGFYIDYGNIRKIGHTSRRVNPDVVLLFNIMGLGGLGIVNFLQASGIPVILYCMDNLFVLCNKDSREYGRYVSIFGPPEFSSRFKVIAMSKNVAGEIGRTLGTALNDVLYIPGWIHLADTPKPNLDEMHATTRFVVCSRIAPHKGTDLIVDATEELNRRGVKKFSIDVYGAGEVGPFLQKVQSKGVGDIIRYCGSRPKTEMLALFGEYDTLLFPTWEREAFGFTVSEAAAAGCFSIMTMGIGAGEWFVDDLDCMKIARTTDALVTAMYRTILLGPEGRKRFRVAAQKNARRYLASDRWIRRIEQECLRMSDQKGAANCDSSRAIEAAFLFLSQMFKPAAGIPADLL